jgi:taurine dioxygenase
MRFAVRHVAGALGGELSGVDLTSMDDADVGDLRALIHEHEVVLLGEVWLTEEQHLALGRALGTPSIFPISRLLGGTEPSFQRNSDGPESPSEADSWHTDVTWVAEPPKYALLCAEIMPDRGGDTIWASMTAAYDALSPTMQRIVSDLRVVHDNEVSVAALRRKTSGHPGAQELAERLRSAYPPVVHPLVRTHPDTGRPALFLGGQFHAPHRGHARRRKQSRTRLPGPPHRRTPLPLPVAMDAGRPRDLGRTVNESPKRRREAASKTNHSADRDRRRPSVSRRGHPRLIQTPNGPEHSPNGASTLLAGVARRSGGPMTSRRSRSVDNPS